MAKEKKIKAKSAKKQIQENIAATLQTTFPDLKETVGEKKFAKQVKKASKVLASGTAKKTKSVKAAKK